MESKLLNFRCPADLLVAIDEVGRQRYPANNSSGCDRSKALIDICVAGVNALLTGQVDLPVKDERVPVTRQELDLLRAALIFEISRQVHEAKKPVS